VTLTKSIKFLLAKAEQKRVFNKECVRAVDNLWAVFSERHQTKLSGRNRVFHILCAAEWFPFFLVSRWAQDRLKLVPRGKGNALSLL
jgi:hypothetical protein